MEIKGTRCLSNKTNNIMVDSNNLLNKITNNLNKINIIWEGFNNNNFSRIVSHKTNSNNNAINKLKKEVLL